MMGRIGHPPRTSRLDKTVENRYVNPSKLICSYRLQNSIHRERLTQLLDKAYLYPLVLVNAPAGYGKTMLVSQWASEQQNVGWYSLDEGDNKTERFCRLFRCSVVSGYWYQAIFSG